MFFQFSVSSILLLNSLVSKRFFNPCTSFTFRFPALQFFEKYVPYPTLRQFVEVCFFGYFIYISLNQIKYNEMCITLCFMKQSKRNISQCILALRSCLYEIQDGTNKRDGMTKERRKPLTFLYRTVIGTSYCK